MTELLSGGGDGLQGKQWTDCLLRVDQCLEEIRLFTAKYGCDSDVVVVESGRRFSNCLENVVCDKLAAGLQDDEGTLSVRVRAFQRGD